MKEEVRLIKPAPLIGILPDLKVGGAEGARTPDPHNAIVLIPIALEALTMAFKNIDRFIDSFFPDHNSNEPARA